MIFRSDFDVELIDHMGTDQRIVAAAKVSTKGAEATDEDSVGLIGYLMKNRHGSPFEHTVFTWRITAPIFVWREFHRHRIASYNEESGRYKQLDPVFYIPDHTRALRQVGRPGHYEYIEGTEDEYALMTANHMEVAELAYSLYDGMIKAGIAREVARMSLPLNIYSTCYVTMNARALMNFLSLRTKSELAVNKSTPQWEINKVACQMEDDFEELMPQTYGAFNEFGRQQP